MSAPNGHADNSSPTKINGSEVVPLAVNGEVPARLNGDSLEQI